jgi:pyruvate dehydrogenase E1 component alpha subunit/2-oxoisovalerate dehydrogenase E1 component alpha subunit
MTAAAAEDDPGKSPTGEGVNRAPDDPALGLFGVLGEDGTIDPSFTAPDDALALRMYREMKRVRLLDQRMVLLQRQGRVGFYGACTGQEAAVVGSALAASPDDWIFPALRENAIMLVRGFALTSFIAQIYGTASDSAKGRQMPNHVSSRTVHQVSWSSCVGTQLPHAVGAAWAAKLRGDRVVTLGFLGDGATSESDFHAALNFAGVYQVPSVLICQNNQWAISVPLDRQSASATVAIKARAYGVPGVRVDGNDVIAVHHVVSEAIERARGGGGPTFVELLTYRIAPHSTSDDPSRYRRADDVDSWARKDPLDRFARYLRARGIWKDEDEERLDREILEQIAKAIEEVESAGPPDRASLFDDVYATMPWHLAEQLSELERTPLRRPPGSTTSQKDPK